MADMTTHTTLCVACDLGPVMPPHYGDPDYDHSNCPSVTARLVGGMPYRSTCYSCGQDARGGAGVTFSNDPDNEHFLCPTHLHNIGVDVRATREANR